MNYVASQYNNFITYNDEILAFNAMSGAFLVLPNDKYDNFCKNENNFNKLKDSDQDFFDLLVKTRFLIDTELLRDELDIIRFRYKRDVFIDNKYHLIINPTLDCNFCCWYCYETKVKDSKISQDTIDRILLHVKNLIELKSISYLSLNWFGGEPLLCFEEVYEISKKLKDICNESSIPFNNSMTTNGYLINDERIKLFKDIDLYKFQITLDGNKHLHDKSRILLDGKPTYDTIVRNINEMCSLNKETSITLRINYKNESISNIDEIISDFNPSIRSQLNVNFQRIWQTIEEEVDTNDKFTNLLNIFQENGFNINKNNLNTGNGYKCYADRWHEAVINYDGTVFKCTARNFAKEEPDGFIDEKGKINWHNYNLIKRFGNAPFENEKCLNCKILPICLGPCSQKSLSGLSIDKLCDMMHKDISIDELIINKYIDICNRKNI